ncbi:MAG: replicative DNA helicase, partial [Clostridia bacterium]|nr:replicative DNA helicase [Clostridia bacterium]
MPQDKKDNAPKRNVPCSLEAEQAVLGAIISDNDVAVRIVCDIDESDFYASIYKTILRQIKLLTNQNKPI